MPRITKAIIKASLNPERLYSKAEDVALKMKQLKNIGSDARRHFIKKGVTKEELDELGLTELFEQRRVTQAEILERIDENRIEFEEEIAIGGRESDVDFDIQNMDMEEYFGGARGVEEEMDYEINESIRDYYYTEFVDQADDTLDDRERALKKWSQNELDFDDLPSSLQNELRENAYENISTMYYDQPATVVQLYVDGSPVEGYRLVQGPYDDSFTPPNDAPPSLRREFGVGSLSIPAQPDTSVRSVNEAQVRLSQHALDQGEMELAGDTRWAEYTVDGGENYREIRYRLAGPEKFREGTHFPDDVNNVFHARVTDRVDTEGNNVLFVEELQSDWAQQGRRSGFKDPEIIARGEDEIRSAFEANDLNKILSDFEANVEFPNALSFLKELHFAGRPGAGGGYREKMSKLSRFLRDYRRNLENQKEHFVIDFLEDNLSDYDKIDLARYEVDLANERIGATGGFGSRYKMPDLETEKGRDELDVLVRQNLKRQSRSMSAGNQPTQQVSKILFEKFPVASPGAGYDVLERQAEMRAKVYLDNLIVGNGLPRNIVSAVEDTIDRVKPGLVSDLRAEAMKPQAAPFVRDSNAWNKLAVKRLVTLATDEGYDKVMFSPSEVQIDRWGEEGLRGQYDVNIPKAIKQVTGSKPGETTFRTDYGIITGPSIDLSQKTPTGETVAERARAGQTMFMAPIAAAGLAGLAAPEMAEAGEVPIDEGIGRLPKSSGEERGVLEEVGDFLRYGPEVGLDALNAMIVRPIAGSTAGRLAYDLGGDPEAIRRAQAETEALVDYEASPGAEAYGQRILGGIGELLESEAAQKAAPYVAPVLDALEQASEGLTSGIIGLNERMYGDDDDERTDAFLEVIRPGIEATQPI